MVTGRFPPHETHLDIKSNWPTSGTAEWGYCHYGDAVISLLQDVGLYTVITHGRGLFCVDYAGVNFAGK